jgi:ribonuclease HII
MGLAAECRTVSSQPCFDLEAALMDEYSGPVVGIDEAGRGPWAGPVVVAAVILNPDRIPEGLNDSKLMTAEAREDRYVEIMATACVAIAIGHVRRIDRDNILQASLWGMRAAYRGLGVPAAAALIDGNIIPRRFPCQARAIVGGDGLSLSVAAASIVAKVTRDRMMTGLAEEYPAYGFARHKGYSTRSHMRALARHGPCPEHRASFANVNGLVRDLPVVDQEVDEDEVAGPQEAGQAVTEVEAEVEAGPVADTQLAEDQMRSGELLGGELAYR